MTSKKEMTKAIVNARAFVKDGETFQSIVEMCMLRPKDGWKCWYDDGKNLLKINKNSSIRILPSKTREITTKDIYRKSRPKYIAENSSWALIASGEDEFDNEASVIWFLGKDKRLRVCFFVEDCWVENVLPLLSGFNILKLVHQENQNNILKRVKFPNDVLKLKVKEAFTTQWPPNNKQIQLIEPMQKSVKKVLKVCGI